MSTAAFICEINDTLNTIIYIMNPTYSSKRILELRPRDHISDALRQLHWLPVDRQIRFKLCVLMHSAHTSRCPRYLTDVLKPAAKYNLRSGLHSSSTNNYILPRLQSRLGERAFSYAGPLAWNSLLADLQNIPDSSSFKKRLKTFLFNSAF